MSIRITASAVAFFAVCAMPGIAAAQANVMKECGAEYQAAKAANTLGDKKWKDFLSDCRTRHAAATPATTSAPAPTASAPAAPPVAPAAPATKTASAPASSGAPAVFPKAIDAKYSSQKAAQQRMHTCLDQYKVNKSSNGNGGMKWIEKGGGYYSKCNASLKG